MNSPSLLDVAAAVADGTPVDWDSAERLATTDEDRRLLEELRFIAGMVRPVAADSSSSLTRLDRPVTVSLPVASATPHSEAAFWGPLKLLEHVGRGTFGDVYRAWDSRLDREVALKILRQREQEDEARVSTVIQEGRLLARVRHPNVVTVYGAERIDGRVGMWMEFIHGQTLEQELRQNGPFAVDRVIDIGVDLADALTTVHRAGLIHGDVKTHNVMSGSDGRIVLTDFGAGFELDETLGDQRDVAGTPVCIAPEVFAGQSVTPASDVYSLGVLLYHLVTGTYPVRGATAREVREAHASGTRTTLATERADLPSAFVRVVDRALDPHPDSRYQSPAELGAELALLRPPAAAATRPRGSGAWLYAAMATAVIVVGAIASRPLWSTPKTPTVAVMPFENLSPDPNSEYFVDGLTDEIIRNLSVIDGLDVRSRTSSFMFKGKARDIRDIARQLRATYVMEGSVLRSDGRLRINAQLVRAADDVPLWSKSFDRESKDVFTVQDEISRAIVNELRLTLGRGQRRYQTNLEAYDLYLKARAHGSPVDPKEAKIAADLFQRVIDSDPSFAPAYAGLADAWAAMSINRLGVPAKEAFSIMEPAALKALELDPLLAEAHAAKGLVFARARNWKEAEAAFHRALDLNRTLSSVHSNFVMSTLWPQGKVDASLRQLEAALSADPLSVDVQRLMAYVLVSAGQYDQSIAFGRRALAVNPEHPHTRQVLARALFQKGARADAIRRLEQMGPGTHNFLGHFYGITGRRAEAEKLAAQHQDFPARVALIYAGLGDADRTFDALDRMNAEGHPLVGIYLTYPEFAFLGRDPRLRAFRLQLGLAD
jgi:TolB-like protein/Flp pilus assembly protein TadD/predicted Ser/Thr protein kinase